MCAGAGKEPGLLVWRIVALSPELVDAKEHGRFYSGDTYILLHTKQIPQRNKFTQDIYFWLGEKTSVDEQGAASIMVVELDDGLGGVAVQHREVKPSSTLLPAAAPLAL